MPNRDVPATGVIEGAIRYLIKDRMDIISARWSLEGAEAVLRLRSLHVSSDWNEHWRFHLLQERPRHHLALHQGSIPLLKDVTQARCFTTPLPIALLDYIFLKEPHPKLNITTTAQLSAAESPYDYLLYLQQNRHCSAFAMCCMLQFG